MLRCSFVCVLKMEKRRDSTLVAVCVVIMRGCQRPQRPLSTFSELWIAEETRAKRVIWRGRERERKVIAF